MSRSFATLSMATLLLLTSNLGAQVSPPHIGYVYPAGGQRGATFEVKLGGQYFNQATEVHVSGAGVKATILRQTRPLTPREISDLETKLQQLNKKAPKTPADDKEITTIREQLAKAAIPVPPPRSARMCSWS